MEPGRSLHPKRDIRRYRREVRGRDEAVGRRATGEIGLIARVSQGHRSLGLVEGDRQDGILDAGPEGIDVDLAEVPAVSSLDGVDLDGQRLALPDAEEEP